MKIVIPGGTGQVGTVLARAFHPEHEVVVLSRGTTRHLPWRVVAWDGRTLGPWAEEIDGADVVINLAGRSVNCRYHERNRHEIIASRVQSVLAVGEVIQQALRPPRVWLQASTATIYAHTYGAPHGEDGTIGGSEPGAPDTWNFSIDVATSWERAFDAFESPRTRKVKMRSAITMSPDQGGAFSTLLALVRCGLGGASGSGKQYVSWIHETDFVNAVRFLIERDDLSGPTNIAAPMPLPNRDFMAALRQAWGIPFGLPAMEWMLEVGAVFLRTETELILKSRRVAPTRLLQEGFRFQYPEWPEAAKELCRRWRESG